MSAKIGRKPVNRLVFRLSWLFLIAGAFCTIQASEVAVRSQLRGRVLDPNRAAIANVKITASGKAQPESATITDANGEFSLPLEPGEYMLKVAAEGFAEASLTIRSKPTSFEPLEIVLQLAGYSASVTVTDIAGYDTFATRSATRTLTALRDVPQSITVVSRQLIKDQ